MIPLNVRAIAAERKMTQKSYMAKGGENKRDLPQLLNANYALQITNYLITSDGGLTRRKGIQLLFSQTGSEGISMIQEFTDDIIIFAYADTVKAYQISTDTVTTIKTFSSESDSYDGRRYGDYFFVTNGKEKIGRISRTLNYDNQTVNFVVGGILTGATSGATAIILQDVDAGVTGTLTLGNILPGPTGLYFQDNEIVTGSLNGSATANGTINWVYTTISGAPICHGLEAIGARLFAYNLSTDPTAIAYAHLDPGVNPPFETWTVGTMSADGGLVNYRNIGEIQSVVALGDNIVAFGENGKFAFTIDTITLGTDIAKVDTFVIQRVDFGGARGAIVTPKGLFYVNEAGLWQLQSLGQSNIPFSSQEGLASVLLGTQYFDNIDFSDADMAYVPQVNTILITCRRNSDQNNFVLAYNTEQKAFSEFTGWNIKRFFYSTTTGDLYASGSFANKVWTALDGYDDDGNDVWYEYYQEIQTGDLFTRQIMYGQYCQGLFSPSTTLQFAFDIYDSTGTFIPNKLVLNWSVGNGFSSFGDDGFGLTAFAGGMGGYGSQNLNMIETFNGGRNMIRNYQRIRVRITGHDKIPHQLNWLSLDTMVKIPIRRRNLSVSS